MESFSSDARADGTTSLRFHCPETLIRLRLELCRVAAIQFSGNPSTEFSFNTFTNSDDAQDYFLNRLRHKRGVTNTGRALDHALTQELQAPTLLPSSSSSLTQSRLSGGEGDAAGRPQTGDPLHGRAVHGSPGGPRTALPPREGSLCLPSRQKRPKDPIAAAQHGGLRRGRGERGREAARPHCGSAFPCRALCQEPELGS